MSNRSDHFFIYPKGVDGHPLGSAICVILRNGKMYHGEATCSPDDQFDKKIGRDIAYKRALQAAGAASNSNLTTGEALYFNAVDAINEANSTPAVWLSSVPVVWFNPFKRILSLFKK